MTFNPHKLLGRASPAFEPESDTFRITGQQPQMKSEESLEKPVLPVSINVPPVPMDGEEVLNEINQLENQFENI